MSLAGLIRGQVQHVRFKGLGFRILGFFGLCGVMWPVQEYVGFI